MIHYLTPFDTNKQIGAAHNAAVELIKDPESWICLRDPDTMFLTPDFGNVIEEVVYARSKDYELFGCLTNRLSVPHQLYDGFSSNSDMAHHISIANQVKRNNTVKPCNLVAGMFMLFQKKTWEKVGGFRPSIYFDKFFSENIIKSGGRLGILQSVYVFHLYRWGADQSQAPYTYNHLI